jgi:PAS domain S-box-containing protein
MPDSPPEAAVSYVAAIVASADDAIISTDLQGLITSWNPAAARLFGYAADEAIGRPIRIIIPVDHRSDEEEVLRRIARGESVVHFETVRRRKDGSTLPISVSISPIRDSAGRVIGSSKIARDITERRRVDEAIAAAERARSDLQHRLLALVGASSSLLGSPHVEDVVPASLALASSLIAADGYAMWRLEASSSSWRIESYSGVSTEFATRLITTAADMLPAASTEPVIAENVASDPRLVGRLEAFRTEGITSMLSIPLMTDGEATAALAFYYRTPHVFSDVELETARALGALTTAALRTAELYDAQHRIQQQASFLAQAGEVLASSLNYRQTLGRMATLAVPSIADWCAIDIVNDAGDLDRIAIAHEDPQKVAIGRRISEAFPPSTSSGGRSFGDPDHVVNSGRSMFVPEITDAMLASFAQSAEHADLLLAVRLRSYICVPLRTREGVLGALTFLSAESGRRFTLSDLQFAETVAGRAALAIENARSYDEARRANRLKDEFLATLSHELRTPLNAILGYTRMLRAGIFAAEKHDRALETVERNASALAQIVGDVLDVARIVSGKLRLEVRLIDLDRLIAEAIETVLPAAQAKGVTLEQASDGEIPQVSADTDRLQQVLWNLLANAVKFTARGGRVIASTHRTADGVAIVVADTGQGIRPDVLPYIFDRFRQGDSGSSREHGGLGLGLAIARHIVEMHGGTIQAASEGEGRGAEFTVRLPTVQVSSKVGASAR